MSSNESHDKIINHVYYNPAGDGSIPTTFKEAFQTYKYKTLNIVKQWFKSSLGTTKQVKGSNSSVAPYPYYEYQLDLMLFSDLKHQVALARNLMY